MAINFLNNIDVSGEVKGTSLDINGNADISGNLTGVDSITASATIQAEHLRSTDDLVVDDDATITGDLTVTGDTYGLYHRTTEDGYYFDTYQGDRNLSLFLKNQRADIIRYQPVANVQYWDGSAWQDGSSQLANVKKLLDGRQDTGWNVPETYYKFRFTTQASTGWPTRANIGIQTGWSGSLFPGLQMLVEQLDPSDNNYDVHETMEFGGQVGGSATALNSNDNGIDNWGLMFKASNGLHDGDGDDTNGTRITIDFSGWSPSNASYVTIPMQNIFITSNYAGTENTDYTNLLSHDTFLRLGDSRKLILGAGDDLAIYHDGSNSYISDDGTGVLYIRSGGSTAITVNGTAVTLAGTINSGAITSTGQITGTELEGTSLDINGNADISGNLVLGSYTVASQGDQSVFGKLTSFQSSGSTNLLLGVKNGSYPNRGWSFDPVLTGVNCNLIIKEHGSTAERIKISTGGNFEVLTGSVTATGLDINGNADISGNLGVGITSPVSPFHLKQDDTDTGTGSGITVENDGTGDALVQYLLTGTRRWVTGIDNSDSDSFKISSSATLGSDDVLTLNTSGNATFAGDITCGDDLFMPSAGVINFNSGDMTITHTSNNLDVAGGTFKFTFEGDTDYTLNDLCQFVDGEDSVLITFGTASLTLAAANTTVSGNLNVAADIIHTGDTDTKISFGTDTITFTCGNTAIYTLGSSSATMAGILDITNTTDSSNATGDTGALRCEGGASIAKKLYVGSTITGSADVIAYSDERLKENVKTLDGKKVLEMRGVSFDRVDTGKTSSGVIAQEIEKIAPELVIDDGNYKGVAYGNLVGYLIEAIKDQQKQIDELKEMCSGCSK